MAKINLVGTDSLHTDKVLIRRKELAAMLGVSCFAIDRWRKAGKLPEPTSLGGKFVAWHKDVIDSWLEKNFNKPVESV